MNMIKGVKKAELKTQVDEKGYLVEISEAKDSRFNKSCQINLIGNFTRGAIKAFFKNAALWNCVIVSHGTAKIILVDGRKKSPTHKEINAFVLSSKNPGLIIIPPEVYFGWMPLEDDTQIINIASGTNKKKSDVSLIAPDFFGDIWTIKGR